MRENVALANQEMTDEQVWQLLEQANIHEFHNSQPLGLATPIGEQSSTLSVGQAQRIALRGLGTGGAGLYS